VVAIFAKAGRPDVHITTVRNKGEVKYTQADEFVEIVNRGTVAANISGWTLGADDAGQDFTFPPGTVLQPGQRIRNTAMAPKRRNPDPPIPADRITPY
jgi:Lamin Tail Domain